MVTPAADGHSSNKYTYIN
jgi:hypothetical protein